MAVRPVSESVDFGASLGQVTPQAGKRPCQGRNWKQIIIFVLPYTPADCPFFIRLSAAAPPSFCTHGWSVVYFDDDPELGELLDLALGDANAEAAAAAGHKRRVMAAVAPMNAPSVAVCERHHGTVSPTNEPREQPQAFSSPRAAMKARIRDAADERPTERSSRPDCRLCPSRGSLLALDRVRKRSHQRYMRTGREKVH